MANFASMADSELGGFFSDLHKDVWGFRPNRSWDRAEVIAFCLRWTSAEATAELEQQWAEEEEYFKELEREWEEANRELVILRELQTPDRYESMAIAAGY